MVVIGLLWIPVIQGGKGLYDYLQGVQAYLAPPIAVVFFLGVFIKRMNAKGCLSALIVGFVMGIFRLAVDTPVKLLADFSYAQGSLLWLINNTFFQYYSLLITIICIVVMIAVSYWSEKPDYTVIQGLTFSTMTDQDRLETRQSWDYRDVLGSVLVLLIILAAYLRSEEHTSELQSRLHLVC